MALGDTFLGPKKSETKTFPFIRPPVRTVLPVMFFFISFATRSLRSPGRSPWNFATWSETGFALKCKSNYSVGGGRSQKMGTKNIHNFVRFYKLTTSDFDREYLRNGSTYRKSESSWSTTTHPTLGEKVGELLSRNDNVICVKWTFSGDYILALRGCCPSNF